MFDRFKKQTEVGKGVLALMETAQLSREEVEDVYCALLAKNMLRGRRQAPGALQPQQRSRPSRSPSPSPLPLRAQVMILSQDKDRGRVTLSTKKLEPEPGDFLRDPAKVFEKAEEMV